MDNIRIWLPLGYFRGLLWDDSEDGPWDYCVQIFTAGLLVFAFILPFFVQMRTRTAYFVSNKTRQEVENIHQPILRYSCIESWNISGDTMCSSIRKIAAPQDTKQKQSKMKWNNLLIEILWCSYFWKYLYEKFFPAVKLLLDHWRYTSFENLLF